MDKIEMECCRILERELKGVNALNYHFVFEKIIKEILDITSSQEHLDIATHVMYQYCFDTVPTALRDKDNFNNHIKRIVERI